MKTTYRPLDAAALEQLISAAVAAPSVHNTQPWRYRLNRTTATLELHAAPERMMRHADPHGRALHLSAGASLFNLRIAVAHAGWNPVVRLLPGHTEPTLLATVRLAGPRMGGGVHRTDLYGAIWRRHSSRFPFSDRPLPQALVTELVDAARTEGATAYLPGRQETARLLGLTAEAERRNAGDEQRCAESHRWVHAGPPHGIPAAARGARDAAAHLPVRELADRGEAGRATFEPTPTVAVLATAYDTPADWLRAGQALEHMLLTATDHGARASLLHQALEWPDLRWALRDTARGPGHVQMLIRLGYGPAGPATPRRGVDEVLDTGR
jgi:Nitroreductase family